MSNELFFTNPRTASSSATPRAALTAAVAAGGLAIHLVIQRLAPPPVWRAPAELVDLTPFLPWTIWIYLLFFPLMILTGALVPRDRWVRLVLAWSLASVASWALILLAPVTFTRPTPGTLGALHAWVLGRVYGLDSAHVTFPCLHSAVTWICWRFLGDARPRWSAGVFALAAAITISTMTARQHLITDNAAGLAIAWACVRTVAPRPARRGAVRAEAASVVRDQGDRRASGAEPKSAGDSRS